MQSPCNVMDAPPLKSDAGTAATIACCRYTPRGAAAFLLDRLWVTIAQELTRSYGFNERRSPWRRLLRSLAKEMHLRGAPAQRHDLSLGNHQEGASVEGRVDGCERLAQGWRGSA